jgi:hypothetical protein
MKLADFEMREAFAAQNWKAVQEIMADYFCCPEILEIKNIFAYGNASVQDVIIKLGGSSFRWTEGYGFQSSAWAYEDVAYICYRGPERR